MRTLRRGALIQRRRYTGLLPVHGKIAGRVACLSMILREYNRIAEKVGTIVQYRGTVVSIHGVGTRGAWQKNISPVIQDAALRHIPLDYGCLAIGAFFRRWQDSVVDQIVTAVTQQQDRVPDGPHGVMCAQLWFAMSWSCVERESELASWAYLSIRSDPAKEFSMEHHTWTRTIQSGLERIV